jgi:hypothetical protein
MTSDEAQASIAGALIRADLQFQTIIGKSADGSVTRLFQAVFDLLAPDGTAKGKYNVTMYVGGAVLTAVAPLRLSGDLAKRHEISDFITGRMPLVRVFPQVGPGSDSQAHVIWLEASAPMPSRVGPLDPELPTMVFMVIASAIPAIISAFPNDVETDLTAQPIIFSATKELAPSPMPAPASVRTG